MRSKLSRHGITRRYQVGHDSVVDIHVAFVFSEISNLVTFGQYAPDFRTKSKRVRQNLKYDVSVPRTKTVMPQSGETKGVCGVIGEVEAALHGKGCVACVRQARKPGPLQACELGGIRRLRDKGARNGKAFKRGAHLPHR